MIAANAAAVEAAEKKKKVGGAWARVEVQTPVTCCRN
jgi:hypothetical protein